LKFGTVNASVEDIVKLVEAEEAKVIRKRGPYKKRAA
jgi:hypothetical protein